MSKKNSLEAKKARRQIVSDRRTYPSYYVTIRHKVSEKTKLVPYYKAERLTKDLPNPGVGMVFFFGRALESLGLTLDKFHSVRTAEWEYTNG